MVSTSRKAMRSVVAVATSAMLAGTGLAAAPTASAALDGTILRVAVTDHGLYLNGPTTFPAGRVALFVDAAGRDRAVAIVRFDPGFSFHDFRADGRVIGQNLFGPGGNKKKGLRALNHSIRHITAYGGVVSADGADRHGRLLLDVPSDRYVLFDDSGRLPRHPVHLTVTAPAGAQTLPETEATVVAKTNRRFGGDDVLPATGNITFVNRSTESPHFLVLQHVKEGTTRKQVIDSFSSDSQPTFVRRGEQDAEALTTDRRMHLHLHLPAGQYALMCFFPDPKTGMPHAFMGMVRMVHLK